MYHTLLLGTREASLSAAASAALSACSKISSGDNLSGIASKRLKLHRICNALQRLNQNDHNQDLKLQPYDSTELCISLLLFLNTLVLLLLLLLLFLLLVVVLQIMTSH